MRFLLVGFLAAGVEFVFFNWFVRFFWCSVRVRANLVAVTVAMSLSFLLNRNWTFADTNSGSWPVMEFVVVTLIAAYGLQSFVIWVLSVNSAEAVSGEDVGRRIDVSWIGLPGREVKRLAYGLAGCGGAASAGRVDFVERNLVKGAALGVALIWNFSWYRWYVFS